MLGDRGLLERVPRVAAGTVAYRRAVQAGECRSICAYIEGHLNKQLEQGRDPMPYVPFVKPDTRALVSTFVVPGRL